MATSLYPPWSRGRLRSLRWGRLMISSLPFPPQPKLAEVLQEQCPKPPDYPVWDGKMTLSSCSRNEPALQNRHWLKCRAGMGSREALPVCTGIPLGERATGPSSENNWSKHQFIKCTKGPGGWQHILDSTSFPTVLQKEAAKTCPIPWACIWWVSRVPQGTSAEHPASTFRFELPIELVTAARWGHFQSCSATEKDNNRFVKA